MEKKLSSSLKSSAQEFLNSVTKANLKSSKSIIKTLIHTINPSSDLSSSLPLRLHHSISECIVSFQNLPQHPPSSSPPSPGNSPLTKRLRRTTRKPRHEAEAGNDESDLSGKKQHILDALQVLSFVASSCVSHPKNTFASPDLLPAVQELHDSLVVFESDPVLSNEVAILCEEWWKGDLPGKETLISQCLPFLLSRSLTLKKKVDVQRVYALRDAFTLFEFEDESIEDLKKLLMRCVVSPLYMKTEEGIKFLAFAFGLSRQLLKEVLAMIKAQIPYGRKSVLEGYGEILFRGWRLVDDEFKLEIEDGFLQDLIEGSIHASSGTFGASVRRVLGGFIIQRTTDGVEKLLFRLAEPIIFRSLQVANSNIRQNALHLLLDLFPLEDPDATKEEKDVLLDKQFFLLERLLGDDCPDIRVVAVEGCCRVLHLFWEIISPSTITKVLTVIFKEMSHDRCSEVRVSTLSGVIYLLGNPQSHEILKVLLPRLGHLMLDNVISVRVAVADLLLLLMDLRSFQFNKVVSLDVLLSTLENDQPQVAQKITRLLMPSYFPSRLAIEESCNRCVTLLKRNPMAGASFCKFALSEGSSHKSLVELVKVLVNLVLLHDKLNPHQIEGLVAAVSYLCKDLASETVSGNNLKEFFAGEKVKCLFTAAPTARAQSAVFDIVSTVSPDDVAWLLEDCMRLVSNCSGLSEDVVRQKEVRSAHKLLLSCNVFDDMLEGFTQLLQKTSYRCHVKFGTEIQKQTASSAKKRCKASGKVSVKWKHISGKRASNFEEDYLTAVGVAWQIKDLLLSENTRKAILESRALDLFLALKVLTEVSIVQSMQCEYMDIYPVLSYTSLALHITLQNADSKFDSGTKKKEKTNSGSSFSESILEQTMDHLLSCTEKFFGSGDPGTSGDLHFSNQKKSKTASKNSQKCRETKTNVPNSDDGTLNDKQKRMLSKVKILSAILKFIVDSTSMGFVSHFHGRCSKFISAYMQYVISIFWQQSSDELKFKEQGLKDIILCLKSSISYASKFLNIVLSDTSEASPPPTEVFDIANNLLDLVISIESCFGSSYAVCLISAIKPWLPDLVLALGCHCILRQTEVENMYVTAWDQLKLWFPLWPSILAKTELSEISREEDDVESGSGEFSGFKKLMAMIVVLLKGSQDILDAFGLILLTALAVGLDKKDYDLVLGLIHFLCVKLIGEEDSKWTGHGMLLVCLPEIYPRIETEIDEEEDEDERRKLVAARDLLEPVWMYHVYETERFATEE